MYCNSCGSQVPEGTKFCPNCGASLVASAAGSTSSFATPHYADAPAAPQPAASAPSHQQTPPAQQVPPAQPYGQQPPYQGQPGPQGSYGQQAPYGQPGQQAYGQPYGAPMGAAPRGSATPGVNFFGIAMPLTHPMTPAAVNLSFLPQPQPPAPVAGLARAQVITYAEQSGLKMKWYKFISLVGLILGGIALVLSGLSNITGAQYAAAGGSASLVYSFYPAMRFLDIFYGLIVIAIGVGQILSRKLMMNFSKRAPWAYYCLTVVSIVASFVYGLGGAIILGSGITSIVSSLLGGLVGLYLNMVYFNKRAHLFVNE